MNFASRMRDVISGTVTHSATSSYAYHGRETDFAGLNCLASKVTKGHND